MVDSATMPDEWKGSPILAEMQRLSPGYVPDGIQGWRMLSPENPQKVADLIESRMNDVKEDAVRWLRGKGIPIKEEHISNEMALQAIREFAEWGALAGQDQKQADRIRPSNLVRIGMIIQQEQAATSFQDGVDHAVRQFGQHNPFIAAVAARWQLVFKRIADPAGLGFWLGTGLDPKEIEGKLVEARDNGAT